MLFEKLYYDTIILYCIYIPTYFDWNLMKKYNLSELPNIN